MADKKEVIDKVEEALAKRLVEQYRDTLYLSTGIPLEVLEADTGIPAPIIDRTVKHYMKTRGLHRVRCTRKSRRGICIAYKDDSIALERIGRYIPWFPIKVREFKETLVHILQCRKDTIRILKTCSLTRDEIRSLMLKLAVLIDELGLDEELIVSKYRIKPGNLVDRNGVPYSREGVISSE